MYAKLNFLISKINLKYSSEKQSPFSMELCSHKSTIKSFIKTVVFMAFPLRNACAPFL